MVRAVGHGGGAGNAGGGEDAAPDRTCDVDAVSEIVCRLPGGTDLAQLPVEEQCHPVGHAQCLLPVMGHQNHGHGKFLLQLQHQTAHLLPEVFVQCGERFIQKQQFGLSSQSSCQSDPLLLDEPCSALDVKSTQIIEQLLLKLKEKYTIVIVTHNLFQARRIGDDCIFMLNGQFWEQNTTEELFGNPQRQETKDYLQGAYA